MILLIDIGNTHTHLGLADARRVRRTINVSTRDLLADRLDARARTFMVPARGEGVSLCSVVPRATPAALRLCSAPAVVLSPRTLWGVGINYPQPNSIGPDRLANAVAARHHFGAPVVVVDFGTAVTFDVVDRRGDYVGGIIAPGLSAMTDYLHEKTALLPAIRIRDSRAVIGRSTEQAMLIGAVQGYRGLVRELVGQLRQKLDHPRLPVVATGGYARLLARRLPEITAVEPHLTLEGLRLVWFGNANRRAERG